LRIRRSSTSLWPSKIGIGEASGIGSSCGAGVGGAESVTPVGAGRHMALPSRTEAARGTTLPHNVTLCGATTSLILPHRMQYCGAMSLAIETVYAELVERCHAAAGIEGVPENATAQWRDRGGRSYLYFKWRNGDRTAERYAGPANDHTKTLAE